MRWPSSTPTGMRTLMVAGPDGDAVAGAVGDDSAIFDPVPWQSWQGSLNPKAPWLRLTTPAPLQVGQTRGLVPGFAPLP